MEANARIDAIGLDADDAPRAVATGTLYGVGMGPGDPELLTLKALRVLERAPVLVHFCKKGRRGNSRTIADAVVQDAAREFPLIYPYTTEIAPDHADYVTALAAFYDDAAARLADHLGAGRDVAILSEGDPFFYGSFMHLWRRLKGRFPIEVIPGVTGMSGCWTRAGTPITWGDDVLTVLPATLPADKLVARLAEADAAVIMKLGRHLPKVRAALSTTGLLARAVYVERGTMAGESIQPLAEKSDDKAPYFSMVLVPGEGRRP
ncbi:precorrin-2 C(20)-methyltransferase [Methylobacterium haplocladii]|uniref:Precorrin-2 C(20)-methyltransferase n=1 Tax=Methylobacterium haplocladii TaxID=1176176 RepID=A0A512IIY2_9HYPH|nr:precorrin-2 C(20)-methyltransferase [Methylobacterium haplocladii]GEO97660.1 precorrin-2 C(20)-methyltransferase [Methylobacterium haplocladii]GJD84465.1 Precorrin-2 C(20)-methyltransferase [Methylobacterium haplocladii]GLS57390.1 precorrin-2 C(20)-methyltransferase [Methylobacterium haplocladii]